jgi:hypothetical protein
LQQILEADMKNDNLQKTWTKPELTIISNAESSENVMHASSWSTDSNDDETRQLFRTND